MTVEVLDEVGAVFFVEVDEDFGVRPCAEPVSSGLQIGPELDVVEDLAVQDHLNGVVLVPDRLSAALQIDDAEAPMGEADLPRYVESVAVGAAVKQLAGHGS